MDPAMVAMCRATLEKELIAQVTGAGASVDPFTATLDQLMGRFLETHDFSRDDTEENDLWQPLTRLSAP